MDGRRLKGSRAFSLIFGRGGGGGRAKPLSVGPVGDRIEPGGAADEDGCAGPTAHGCEWRMSPAQEAVGLVFEWGPLAIVACCGLGCVAVLLWISFWTGIHSQTACFRAQRSCCACFFRFTLRANASASLHGVVQYLASYFFDLNCFLFAVSALLRQPSEISHVFRSSTRILRSISKQYHFEL